MNICKTCRKKKNKDEIKSHRLFPHTDKYRYVINPYMKLSVTNLDLTSSDQIVDVIKRFLQR